MREEGGKNLYTERELNLVRLAAFVDGEGCIGISKSRGKYYSLNLRVINTDSRLIDWLTNNYGGSVHRRIETREEAKDTFNWGIYGKNACRLLEEIRDFLILKYDQADIAIRFWYQCSRWNTGVGRRRDRQKWMVEKEEKYYRQMRDLNQKGRGNDEREENQNTINEIDKTLDDFI